LVYLALAAPKLLPARKAPIANLSDYGLKDYVTEVVIGPSSNLIGQTLKASEIQRKYDIDVLELIRGDSRFAQPLADKVLAVGDILLVRSGREDLLNLRDQRGLDIVPEIKFSQPLEKAQHWGGTNCRGADFV
jgi:hypothetical protein